MVEATKEFLAQQEELYAKRKEEILNTKDELVIKGTTYYVSNTGDDNADGKSPETAWKTIDRVNKQWLLPGDGVLFNRGDIWRGKQVLAMEGVSYGAYGEGDKPKFYGWIEDMADPTFWELSDAEHNIWKYTKGITDPGTLVFNDGEKHSRKLIPSFRNLQFVCRDDINKPFVMADEMTEDLDIYWHFDRVLEYGTSKGETFPIPAAGYIATFYGDLYLRCDKGNPGDVFDSIESIGRGVAFRVGENANVTVDNICMKYLCFGVTAELAEVTYGKWVKVVVAFLDNLDCFFPCQHAVTDVSCCVVCCCSVTEFWIFKPGVHKVSTAVNLVKVFCVVCTVPFMCEVVEATAFCQHIVFVAVPRQEVA